MRAFAPVVFDATHSVQEPGGLGGNASGGHREYAPLLARAAVAAGADGLFIETHPDPDHAKSDAASQIPLAEMEHVLTQCMAVFEAAAGLDALLRLVHYRNWCLNPLECRKDRKC